MAHQYSQDFCKEHGIEYSINSGMVRIIVNRAPTIEPHIEYGTDGQPYRIYMSGGKVVPDLLQGWQYEGTPKGEWISGRINSGDGTYCKCSICNFVDYSSSRANTCPNCKSPMKGGSIT